MKECCPITRCPRGTIMGEQEPPPPGGPRMGATHPQKKDPKIKNYSPALGIQMQDECHRGEKPMWSISHTYLQMGSAGDIMSKHRLAGIKADMGQQGGGAGEVAEAVGALHAGGRQRRHAEENPLTGNNYNSSPHCTRTAPVCRTRFHSGKSGRAAGDDRGSPHQKPTTPEHWRGADWEKDRRKPSRKN